MLILSGAVNTSSPLQGMMLSNIHTFKVNTVIKKKKSLCFCKSKSVYYSLSEEPVEEVGATQTRDTHPHSEGEQSPSEKWGWSLQWKMNSLIFLFWVVSLARSLKSLLVGKDKLILFYVPSPVLALIDSFLSISPLLHSSVFYSRPSSPKSDSELLVKPQELSGPQMQWNWGGFPMVWQEILSHTHTHSCRCAFTACLCCD